MYQRFLSLTHAVPPSSSQSIWFYLCIGFSLRDRGGTVVKVLRCKSEGRWFDSSHRLNEDNMVQDYTRYCPYKGTPPQNPYSSH